MEFHFSSSTWYHVEHYKGNSISVCAHVLFSMWQAGKEIMIIMIVIVKGMRKKKKKPGLLILAGELTHVWKNSWNMHWKGNAEKAKDLATKFHLNWVRDGTPVENILYSLDWIKCNQ